MNFTVQIDTVPYKQKPTEQAGIIKKRLAAAPSITLSLSEFEQRILQGYTFSPGILSGGAGARDWIKQQLFCIDLDNEDKDASKKHIKKQAQNPITLDEVLRRCAAYDLPLALAYETMSSSPDWLKFRLAFVAEYEITDSTARDNIQQALMELFPECDGACKNRDRIFYGGKKILYENGSGGDGQRDQKRHRRLRHGRLGAGDAVSGERHGDLGAFKRAAGCDRPRRGAPAGAPDGPEGARRGFEPGACPPADRSA